MRIPLLRPLVAALILAMAPFCAAEPAAATVQPVPAPTDQQWEALKSMSLPVVTPVPSPIRPAEAAAFRRQMADGYVQQADKLKAFYTDNAASTHAKEAALLEAKALINAARAGDDTHRERLDRLVETVRQDADLPAAQRCEIVAMNKYQQVHLGRVKSEEERFAAIEEIERSLIEEFPDAPNGYEALVRVALYYDDAKGKVLAQEVAAMPRVPAFVAAQARRLLEQYALNGTALRDLLLKEVAQDATAADAAETVLYAWSSGSKSSIAFARHLQKTAPAGMRLIGVSLDRDETLSRATAQTEALGGTQIYDPTGELASRLKFDSPPLAYIAGADGKIRTVCGVRELSRRWVAPRKTDKVSGGGS